MVMVVCLPLWWVVGMQVAPALLAHVGVGASVKSRTCMRAIRWFVALSNHKEPVGRCARLSVGLRLPLACRSGAGLQCENQERIKALLVGCAS